MDKYDAVMSQIGRFLPNLGISSKKFDGETYSTND